ncbi:MAG TPA: Crp/Fnr family transcriptional regulator [Puia sp.]|nr:Crp/Fnr family transcriptional regulator [Puia sp.]
MDYDRIIRNISTYITLDEEELGLFTSLFHSRTIRRNEFLLHAESTCRNMSFVEKGCLKVFYTDDKGAGHIVKFAPEDWWAMDIESFTLQTPSFYSIQAIEESEVLQLSKEDYDLLCDRVPKFERFLRILFQNSFISLQRRIQQGLSDNAEERYRHFQEKYPTLEQRISQKQIASYLGITPEFLSMLRGQLSRRTIS